MPSRNAITTIAEEAKAALRDIEARAAGETCGPAHALKPVSTSGALSITRWYESRLRSSVR
jgi:hypothetical protein